MTLELIKLSCILYHIYSLGLENPLDTDIYLFLEYKLLLKHERSIHRS